MEKNKDVNRYNEMDVWMKINAELWTMKCKKAKLKVRDFVRMCKKRGVFDKGYWPSYTREIFQISEVHDSIPVTYTINDMHGERIGGIFYEQELGLELTV